MYIVEIHHHKKEYRRGDLEDGYELIDSQNFKTRTAAKNFIESKLKGHKNVFREYHKGNKSSYCILYTGVTWTHENTGEKMEEYYHFTLKKTKLR